jgi:hypothetical protein
VENRAPGDRPQEQPDDVKDERERKKLPSDCSQMIGEDVDCMKEGSDGLQPTSRGCGRDQG